MNAPIITGSARPTLAETPYSEAEGDYFVQLSQHKKALAIAVDRTRERDCKQQVRQAVVGRRLRWIIQDVR